MVAASPHERPSLGAARMRFESMLSQACVSGPRCGCAGQWVTVLLRRSACCGRCFFTPVRPVFHPRVGAPRALAYATPTPLYLLPVSIVRAVHVLPHPVTQVDVGARLLRSHPRCHALRWVPVSESDNLTCAVTTARCMCVQVDREAAVARLEEQLVRDNPLTGACPRRVCSRIAASSTTVYFRYPRSSLASLTLIDPH
jgi:hypothetical protein